MRLPNRRPALTLELIFGGKPYLVTAGFDLVDGGQLVLLREVFISGGVAGGAKTGQDLMHVIEDASVAISIALQYGATAAALARSVARLPSAPVAPADLDRPEGSLQREAASIIGAVMDLLAEMEAEVKEPDDEGEAT